MLLLCPGSPLACRVAKPLNFQDAASADLVIIGKVANYVKAFGGMGGMSGFIRLETIRTLKGEDRPEWEMVWPNSTFTVPDE